MFRCVPRGLSAHTQPRPADPHARHPLLPCVSTSAPRRLAGALALPRRTRASSPSPRSGGRSGEFEAQVGSPAQQVCVWGGLSLPHYADNFAGPTQARLASVPSALEWATRTAQQRRRTGGVISSPAHPRHARAHTRTHAHTQAWTRAPATTRPLP